MPQVCHNLNDAKQNLLLNGDVKIWQRNITFAFPTVDGFAADRWHIRGGGSLGTGGGNTEAVLLPGVSEGASFGMRVWVGAPIPTPNGTGVSATQTLENKESLKLYNKSASFQVKVKATGNVNQVTIKINYQTTETRVAINSNILGSISATVNSSTFTTITLPLVAIGTSMTTSGVLGVVIQATGVSSGAISDQYNGFIMEQAILVEGAPPSVFKAQFNSYAQELAACQRYYEKSYNDNVFGGTSTIVGAVIGSGSVGNFTSIGGGRPVHEREVRYKVTKRALATISVWSPSSGNIGVLRNYSDGVDYAPSAAMNSHNGFMLTQPNSEDGDDIAFHFAADSEI